MGYLGREIYYEINNNEGTQGGFKVILSAWLERMVYVGK